jgi:hypothetical protein
MMGTYEIEGEEGTPPRIRSEQPECVILGSGAPCSAEEEEEEEDERGGGGRRNVTVVNAAIAERLAVRSQADLSIKRWQRGGGGGGGGGGGEHTAINATDGVGR